MNVVDLNDFKQKKKEKAALLAEKNVTTPVKSESFAPSITSDASLFSHEAMHFGFQNMLAPAMFVVFDTAKLPPEFPPHFDPMPPRAA